MEKNPLILGIRSWIKDSAGRSKYPIGSITKRGAMKELYQSLSAWHHPVNTKTNRWGSADSFMKDYIVSWIQQVVLAI